MAENGLPETTGSTREESQGGLTRREALTRIGYASFPGAFVPEFALSASEPGGGQREHTFGTPANYEWQKPSRPVTAAVMGAGNRGNVYSQYALDCPDELQIVGVAEPIAFRNERFARTYGVSDERRWVTWEHAFEVPKFADAIIKTTPDHLHYGPAMAALEMGYELIL